jgi:hypothetical protein
MRCPACNAENDSSATHCQACRAALAAPKRRPRRRGDTPDDRPLSPEAQAHNREAIRLYRWCLLALIPFLSLVLAPVLAYQAHRFRRRAAADPTLAGAIPLDLAFWLGTCSAVISWLGLALMALGLAL